MERVNNKQVIIIDSESKTRNHVASIMEFLGYEPLLVSETSKWKSQFEKGEKIIMVLLGTCGGAKDLLAVFRDIKSVDSYLPIILLNDPKQRARFNQELDIGSIATVELPLRYQSLETALQQVQVYRENDP